MRNRLLEENFSYFKLITQVRRRQVHPLDNTVSFLSSCTCLYMWTHVHHHLHL